MSSSIATVAQVSMKQSAINAVQQLIVENVAPMPTVTTTDLPSETGNKEKKPCAPKKVKPTVDVVADAVTEGDVAVVDSAKPEKKPRAPKKVKPTVDVVADAVTEGDVAVVDSSKPEKKPRAPKKVKPTVDAVDGTTEVAVAVVDSTKPEKKPRAPKKVKPTVDAVDGTTEVVDSAVTVAVVDSTKPEKKPRAPKKVKPTVDAVDGTTEVAVAVVDSAKPEKKPRAPKKVKPTVDAVVGVVTEGDVAVVDSAKPEKKPRAPKKVKPTVDVIVSGVAIDNVVVPVVAVDNVVLPDVSVDIDVKSIDSTKPEKKPRVPKKDKASANNNIDNDKNVILQFIEKMSETQVIDKNTYNKLHQSLFPDKSPTTDESSEQQLPDTNVVVKNIVSSEQPQVDVELEEGEEFEEELVTTEFVHKGVLYLKDADDNLYSRNPPHEFVLNLLE
jgi:hypothetical protein